MGASLRVLHLEDDPKDAEVVRDVLEAGGIACEMMRVATRGDFISSLEKDRFDLILADFSLPSFDGMSALKLAAERRPEVPFIFVSGTLGEELAIEALKIGATDYVLKERLSRIVSAVERALREARERAEHHRAEERLRRSEAFLAEAQRISHTGSWSWVLSSGKVAWSDEQYRMLGFRPGEVEPSVEVFLSAVHPDDRARVQQVIEQATRTPEPYEMSYRVVLPGGATRHLKSIGRPVRCGTSEIDEYIGTSADVTEQREAEEELRRMERQLRQSQRLEAMGTLAGGIAHDFNNILGAILGFGEMALRDAPAASRLRRDLDSVMTAAERGRALVERILVLSRSGTGQRVSVHVEKVVREALDLIEAKLPPGIRVEARLDAGRAAMQGDPTQIHQVLMNLGTNAVQAMGSSGILSVSLYNRRCDAPRPASVGTVAAGDYIVLEVADTGSGIAPDIMERIFDPFFSTKDVSVGTGLGLSLVHGIVTDVGGAIDVESAPQAGSVFTVYLPRAGDAPETTEEEALEMPHGNQERVLVVDDEEALVRLTTRTLEELSYLPVGFTSSVAALEAFRSDPAQFDAVITDERMPGISGSALIRELRQRRPSIPIVLMSGYTGGAVFTRALDAGADEVLQKPLKARDLALTLARVFSL